MKRAKTCSENEILIVKNREIICTVGASLFISLKSPVASRWEGGPEKNTSNKILPSNLSLVFLQGI